MVDRRLANSITQEQKQEKNLTNTISVGEMLGWRCWNIDFKKNLLVSYSHDYIWTPGTQEASAIPTEHNTDGFYSLKSYQQVLDYIVNNRLVKVPMVLGTIEIWGQIIEGELGLRAQYASINQLVSIFYHKKDTQDYIPYLNISYSQQIKNLQQKLVYDNNNPFLNDLRKYYT